MTRICTNCDEPISTKRLAALPSSVLCIGCAEVYGQKPCREAEIKMERLGAVGFFAHDGQPFLRRRRIKLATYGLGAAI